jgi:hypothetical protein
MERETIQFVIEVFTLLAIIFAIYKYFRNPDERAEKAICLLKEQILYERKITDKALETQQNCLHSLEKEIINQKNEILKLNNTVIKLSTIIEERIPKK